MIPPLLPRAAHFAASADADFRRMVSNVERKLQGLAKAVAREEITPAWWWNEMLEELASAHARAGFHGRQRAGDLAPFDVDDTRFGALAAQEELPFLQAFQWDLMGERYRDEDGALDAAAIGRRAEFYLSRLYATANEAMAWTDGGRVHWRLGAADHCSDCLELAQRSPYEIDRLPTVPGASQTLCKMACACFLETESGLRGFRP